MLLIIIILIIAFRIFRFIILKCYGTKKYYIENKGDKYRVYCLRKWWIFKGKYYLKDYSVGEGDISLYGTKVIYDSIKEAEEDINNIIHYDTQQDKWQAKEYK